MQQQPANNQNNNKARPVRPNKVIALKDPKLATIVQNHMNEMDEDELEGDEEMSDGDEDRGASAPTPPLAGATPPAVPLPVLSGRASSQPAEPVSGGPRRSSVSPTLGRDEVKQVRAVHAHVVREITKAEDEIMAMHRRHIDVKMAGIKEEIKAIQGLDDKDTVDEYVHKVSSILHKQKKEIDGILGELSKLQGMLKDEEELSRTLTPHVKKGRR